MVHYLRSYSCVSFNPERSDRVKTSGRQQRFDSMAKIVWPVEQCDRFRTTNRCHQAVKPEDHLDKANEECSWSIRIL